MALSVLMMRGFGTSVQILMSLVYVGKPNREMDNAWIKMVTRKHFLLLFCAAKS